LARRAAIIDSLIARQAHFLHLDLGDFSKADEVSNHLETRFTWDMMERMRVAAICPGPRELSIWPPFLELKNRGTIPVVSSNLTVKTEGGEEPVGDPYIILPVNGIKVGLISLMGGGEFASARVPDGVEFSIRDPYTTAQDLVPRVHREADVVVLMSQMSNTDTDRLIQAVPGIDVTLYGHSARYQEKAQKVGETIINQTGDRGQYLGELSLIVDPAGRIVDYGSKNATLGKDYPEDAEVAKLVTEAKAEANEMRKQSRAQRESQ